MTEFRFNVTGAERKELANAVSEILGTPKKYLGTPTLAFQIGEYTVPKDGTLIGEYNLRLMVSLEQRGFEPEKSHSYHLITPRGTFLIHDHFAIAEKAQEAGYGAYFYHEGRDVYTKAAPDGLTEHSKWFAMVGAPFEKTEPKPDLEPEQTDNGEFGAETIDPAAETEPAPVPENTEYGELDAEVAELSEPEPTDAYDAEKYPDYRDLNMTEEEELGLGRTRREDYHGENGMQASDVPEPDNSEEPKEPAQLNTFPENGGLTIEYPLEGFFFGEALPNLRKLVASKAPLLKATLGVDELPIEITPTTVRFPWFKADLTGDEVKAYAEFIMALCQTAIRKKRVTAQPIDTDNPRFSMRVWLISLGMIGPEYGLARKLLIGPLPGESGWRFGKPDRAANAVDTGATAALDGESSNDAGTAPEAAIGEEFTLDTAPAKETPDTANNEEPAANNGYETEAAENE